MRRTANWLVGHPWAVILAGAAVALGLWAASTRRSPHEVRAVFTEAVSVYKGLDVRVDGMDAGKVQGVRHEEGHAVITLGINDDVWPLHQGTTAALRFGTTVGNGTRYVDVAPGPKTAPDLPQDGIIANDKTIETTEFDQLFDTFDAKTRKHIQGTAAGLGRTFGPRAAELGQGVDASGPGLDAVGGLASELSRDEPALRAAVANTDRVTSTLVARRAQLSDVVTVAAATFDTFARNTRGITASLDNLPPALRETKATLARLDRSVAGLDGLVGDLRPGAAELGPLARQLRPALAELRRTVPAAVATLRGGRRAAPDVTALLRRVRPLSEVAAPTLARLAPMVACVRPYAPEVAGLLSTWSSFAKGYDGMGHIGRIWGNYGPTSATSSPEVKTSAFVKATGQGYALVRPPGYNAGKPWFLPQCGAGHDGIDPSKDPEDG
jgi:ABC-type transporter Mla subunit MlaD